MAILLFSVALYLNHSKLYWFIKPLVNWDNFQSLLRFFLLDQSCDLTSICLSLSFARTFRTCSGVKLIILSWYSSFLSDPHSLSKIKYKKKEWEKDGAEQRDYLDQLPCKKQITISDVLFELVFSLKFLQIIKQNLLFPPSLSIKWSVAVPGNYKLRSISVICESRIPQLSTIEESYYYYMRRQL